MTLSDLLLAGSLVLGSHEMGHQTEADKHNVKWSQESIIPLKGTIRTDDKDKLASISGAGFRAQDILSMSSDSKLIRLVSALNKLGYVARNGGDLKVMDEAKGENALRAALLLSAFADLHKTGNEKRNWDLDIWQSESGTPGLVFRRRF